jgi:hypothetical protein
VNAPFATDPVTGRASGGRVPLPPCHEGHLQDMAGVLKGTLGTLNDLKGTFETSPMPRRAPSGHQAEPRRPADPHQTHPRTRTHPTRMPATPQRDTKSPVDPGSTPVTRLSQHQPCRERAFHSTPLAHRASKGSPGATPPKGCGDTGITHPEADRAQPTSVPTQHISGHPAVGCEAPAKRARTQCRARASIKA